MELIPNVINRKSLEKQLKLVQAKIEGIEGELQELDKIRQACLVLMGTFQEQNPESSETTETKKTSARKMADERSSEETSEGNEENSTESLSDSNEAAVENSLSH